MTTNNKVQTITFVAAIVLLITAFVSFASEIIQPRLDVVTDYAETYSVSCEEDMCYLNGNLVDRDTLANYIPLTRVSTVEGSNWECDGEFCYRKSDGRVVGLNPFEK